MAVPYILNKYFEMTGLDLRSSDLIRSPNAATELLNVEFRDTGALNKRKGYQFAVRGDQGSDNLVMNGLAVWSDVDADTGAVNEKLIGVGDELYVKSTDTFTLTYSGSSVATYDITLNTVTSTFQFIIYLDGVVSNTIDLDDGTGASDKTVAELVTDLHAITDFTCTGASLTANEKAAFLPVITNQTVSGTGTDITVTYWESITTPSGLTAPFSGHFAKKNDSSFENATFAQQSDVIFISTGYDNLRKYDGNRVYAAGLPLGVISSTADSAGGTTFGVGTKYDYRVEYEYKDARENIITGQISSATTQTMVGNKDIDVVVHNIKESAGTVSNIGFNLDQTLVNGTQVGVNTIAVTSGHSLKINDSVYLLDGVTGDVVQRKITAIATTTITIDGNAVNVLNTAIISNVKIYVYRTIDYSASGVPGLFYLAKELVNDSANDTQSFTDTLSDSNLQARLQFVEPIKQHGLPPKAKYLTSWRGQIILSGNVENVNTVYYSDIDSPEYFPAADNSFTVDRPVSGIYAQDNILYAFEKNSINGITGDFGTDNFSVTRVSKEGIGCAAHHTIAEVRGSVFFLSREGVFAINETDGLQDIGSAIDPRFGNTAIYDFKQAVGYNWTQRDLYMLFLPVLSNASANPVSADDATTEIYVYDYSRGTWLQWDNFNFMGGIAALNNDLMFIRKTTSGGATPDIQLAKVLATDTENDYADHTESITCTYSTHWENLGAPSAWKKFLRLKIHSLDSTLRSFESDSFFLTVAAQHDWEPSINVGSFTIDFAAGALGWGNTPYGQFIWGEARLKGAKKKLASKKVRSHRLTFSNDIVKENILISGYELEIAASYKEMVKE